MTFRSTEMRMRERLDSNRVEGGREANMDRVSGAEEWSGGRRDLIRLGP